MHCDGCVKPDTRMHTVREKSVAIHDADEATHHSMQQSRRDCTTPLFDKHIANRAFMPHVRVTGWK
jgi:hypothetical protein